MFGKFLPRAFMTLPPCLVGLIAVVMVQLVHGESDQKEKEPQLRFICVSSLNEGQEIVVASRDEEGSWQEYANFKARPSFITGWLPADTGELHLAVRDSGDLLSIGRFTYPSATKRALAVLISDPSKMTYNVDVFDPGKLKFIKGSTLLINYSSLPGAIVLGEFKGRVKPGERMTIKPKPEANGMYRMMAAYYDTRKELIPCYDRYVSTNKEARDIIFLLPDPTLGLKVFSLSEFGPFD